MATKSPKAPYQLTPEQLAKQAARAAKKAAAPPPGTDGAPGGARSKEQLASGKFKERQWVRVGGDVGGGGKPLRIGSWNMLAQTLVRRDLFPGSDCLKWADRQQMLISEITSFKTDILCLQECDRLEAFLPYLPTLDATSAKGPGKKHGLVILHARENFDKVGERVLRLDEAEIRDEKEEGGEPRWRRAGSRETRNIGLMVALKRKGDEGGIIVLTTHLFWHPLYTYERARQLAILLGAVRRFRSELGHDEWPCVLAGDFNTQPFEPSYSLLTTPTAPLTPLQETLLSQASVVHDSLKNVCSKKPRDKSSVPQLKFISPDAAKEQALNSNSTNTTAESSARNSDDDEDDDADDGEGEGEGEGSSSGIKNARLATPEDGLLSAAELRRIFERETDGAIVSLYEEAWRLGQGQGMEGRTLGERLKESEERPFSGANEPNWTSYTPLWHLTLDYLFLVPPASGSARPAPRVTAFLQAHKTEDLEPGLPRKGVSASDHVAVAGEIVF